MKLRVPSTTFTIRTLGNALLSVAFLLTSCENKKEKPAEIAVHINAYQVEAVDAFPEFTYPVSLKAANEVEIRSEVAGVVTEVLFDDGMYVTKGTALARVDATKYQAVYDQNMAQLQIRKAQLDQARTDLQRYKNLWENDAVERIRYDHALSDVKVAEANLNEIQSVAIRSKRDLEKTVIRSPFSGFISNKNVNIGDLMVPNESRIALLSEKETIEADFYITEKASLKIARETQAKQKQILFELILPDGSRYERPGKLHSIGNTVDPRTGTLRISVRFDNPNNILRSGMNGVITIREEGESEQKSLLIPERAVLETLGEYSVFVLKDNRTFRKKIQLGNNIGAYKVVTGGLEAKQLIVVDGVQKVRDSSLVVIDQTQRYQTP